MTFNTLLIANRGEIACRIIETARRIGLRTVAVFSDADRDARHVAMADEAVHIGPSEPARSYLNGAAIIDVAKRTGAGAIHPGYGFLSENPDFVEDVEAAGVIFVGPSAHAIRRMGLKDRAKVLMEQAGVPTVPGYHEADQAETTLRDAAEAIGFPILIKAVAGGGGKGMRAVNAAADFAKALASARAEARTAFGNADVLIEKLIERPRHIEVQIFGDGTSAIHLFERDCSLQRRHQKVLEEAPAPGMTQEMRAAMGAAAVRAAEAVGYSGAGTVEFIVDASEGLQPDRFWFMEMNTRLQVEHPVTEAITGVDLVEWQLRVAAGEPLPMRQEELSIRGHAVEVRLYAEDPATGFLPATGRLAHLAFPSGPRIDTGVRKGDAITAHYDPMIAKITARGRDRKQAFAALQRALDATEIVGLTTNLPFLASLARHEDVLSGNVDTGLIARDLDPLTRACAPADEAWAVAVATAIGPLAPSSTGFALWQPLRHTILLGGRTFTVTIEKACVRVQAKGLDYTVRRECETWWVDGRKTSLRSFLNDQAVTVFGPGGGNFTRHDPLVRAITADSDGDIRAPMPGRVTTLAVADGDSVTTGQPLATLEAMKMEHTLKAPVAGRVADLMVQKGAQVDAGALLLRIEQTEELE